MLTMFSVNPSTPTPPTNKHRSAQYIINKQLTCANIVEAVENSGITPNVGSNGGLTMVSNSAHVYVAITSSGRDDQPAKKRAIGFRAFDIEVANKMKGSAATRSSPRKVGTYRRSAGGASAWDPAPAFYCASYGISGSFDEQTKEDSWGAVNVRDCTLVYCVPESESDDSAESDTGLSAESITVPWSVMGYVAGSEFFASSSSLRRLARPLSSAVNHAAMVRDVVSASWVRKPAEMVGKKRDSWSGMFCHTWMGVWHHARRAVWSSANMSKYWV